MQPPDATPDNAWAPFDDRLAYDWARYHYVRLQSSADDIHEGLDLWHAAIIKHQSAHGLPESPPWNTANDLYQTIDSIKAGQLGWKTYAFRYTGPKPSNPPRWMEESYELNTRDVLAVLEQQLSTKEFDGQFEYTPYQEFDPRGDRSYSNLMSAHWAYREAVCMLLLHLRQQYSPLT